MGRWFAHSQREVPSDGEHTLPVPAHVLYGGAFPLCGMTLRPSAGETMLEALLYPDARASRSRIELTVLNAAADRPMRSRTR